MTSNENLFSKLVNVLNEFPKQRSPKISPARYMHHFAMFRGSVVEASLSQNIRVLASMYCSIDLSALSENANARTLLLRL